MALPIVPLGGATAPAHNTLLTKSRWRFWQVQYLHNYYYTGIIDQGKAGDLLASFPPHVPQFIIKYNFTSNFPQIKKQIPD